MTGWTDADHQLLVDVRAAGLALVGQWLHRGHDVVLPQLVAAPDRLSLVADVAQGAAAVISKAASPTWRRPSVSGVTEFRDRRGCCRR